MKNIKVVYLRAYLFLMFFFLTVQGMHNVKRFQKIPSIKLSQAYRSKSFTKKWQEKEEEGLKFGWFSWVPWSKQYSEYKKWSKEVSSMRKEFKQLEKKYFNIKKKLEQDFVDFSNKPPEELDEATKKIINEHTTQDEYVEYLLQKEGISTFDAFVQQEQKNIVDYKKKQL